MNRALEFDPRHQLSLYNSATLMSDTRRAELRQEARSRLMRLLHELKTANKPPKAHVMLTGASDAPQITDVYFQLAMLAGDDELHQQAEQYYLLVIEVGNFLFFRNHINGWL